MIIPLGKIFKDMKEKDLTTPSGDVATLRAVAIEALLAVYNDEPHLPGADKLKRWELAVKLKNAVEPADFKLDEVVLIKTLIGKAFGPMIAGQGWRMLEDGGNLPPQE